MAGLEPLSDKFVATRVAMHELAEKRLAPARKPDSEISLRQTPGGFGTPWFWDDGAFTQLRVESTELVTERDGERSREPLELDPVAAVQLGDWFAFGSLVLQRVHHECGEELDPSAIVLWPEHFDVAFEAGSESEKRRATYGASPGDDEHPEPYVYIGPWEDVSGELWNSSAFNGAELGYAELLAAPNPGVAALAFLRERFRELTAP